ncbi:MAG: hypothetical protein OIN88_16165 [Candidatus Methanoperedens sp.]|nr:hypothetical protein [Candidatus Methanoperedens sp.]MCZ7358618.1 hypothetical protein [Candidatus Methanoperedens sp.]
MIVPELGYLVELNVRSMFAELKDILGKEETIIGGIGGFIAASTLTHGEISTAMSAIIMRTLEFGIGIYQTNPLGESNISNFNCCSCKSRRHSDLSKKWG